MNKEYKDAFKAVTLGLRQNEDVRAGVLRGDILPAALLSMQWTAEKNKSD